MLILISSLVLLFSALYFDLRYQRIPNKLCLLGLLAALILQVYIDQWHGLGQALLGGGAALALLLPAFYFRILGAGDVKLMIAVGALSGPVLLFWSIVYGIIFGTFTSFVLALYKVGWSGFIKMARQGFIKKNDVSKNSGLSSNTENNTFSHTVSKKSESTSSILVPYAPALTLGWLLACYLSPDIGAEMANEISTKFFAFF